MLKLSNNEEITKILGEESSLDESFPHISGNLLAVWGTQEFYKYYESLMFITVTVERPDRQGFPLEVWRELNKLLEYHCNEYPSTAVKDAWFQVNKR
jgi:hypothetical protein